MPGVPLPGLRAGVVGIIGPKPRILHAQGATAPLRTGSLCGCCKDWVGPCFHTTSNTQDSRNALMGESLYGEGKVSAYMGLRKYNGIFHCHLNLHHPLVLELESASRLLFRGGVEFFVRSCSSLSWGGSDTVGKGLNHGWGRIHWFERC